MIDPARRPVNWISQRDTVFEDSYRVLYADDQGVLRWSRESPHDRVGRWTVRADTRDGLLTFDYLIAELDLGDLEAFFLGAPLRGYHGDQASIFFSDLVPAALAVDLQDHLLLAATVLEERVGIRGSDTPDVYLVGNQTQFEHTSQSTGIDPGWEAGYFKRRGVKPGIYMKTSERATDVRNTAAHEYVHLLMDGFTSGRRLPPWLGEGIARYYQYEVGLQSVRPGATMARMYFVADRARTAATEDNLFPLRRLESRRTWNNRTDDAEVKLQYAQSYMLVRYLVETYGEQSPIEIAAQIRDRATIKNAVETAIGISYAQLEEDFIAWLKEWEDPARTEARPYMTLLQEVIDSVDELRERRENLWEALSAGYDRATAVEGYTALVAESERILDLLEGRSPSAGDDNLLSVAMSAISIRRDWYQVALEARRSRGSIAPANAMIPEVAAQDSAFRRGVYDLRARFNLFD